jgi:aryl-alcohol dehydrogenase-like predicted oxidoreductase
MDYANLGNSGLKVSRIGLGTNNFGGQVNEEDSFRIIRKAMDLGINLIDTANIYTRGKSESIVGKAVQGYRDEVIIATKVGMNTGKGLNETGLSRKHIMSQIRHSLESLGTGFIDIYYLHRFDGETPLGETLSTLNDLVHQGRVRYTLRAPTSRLGRLLMPVRSAVSTTWRNCLQSSRPIICFRGASNKTFFHIVNVKDWEY